MYLVDTSWVIRYLRGDQKYITQLTSFAQQGLAISIITYGEIYQGILCQQQSVEKRTGVYQFSTACSSSLAQPHNHETLWAYSRGFKKTGYADWRL